MFPERGHLAWSGLPTCNGPCIFSYFFVCIFTPSHQVLQRCATHVPALQAAPVVSRHTLELRVGTADKFDRVKNIQAMSDVEIKHTLVAVPAVTVSFDWAHLCSLQSVIVAGPVVLGKAMFLATHQIFWLSTIRPGCAATCQHVAPMRQLFSSHVPQVLCEID